jgi:hypothetical protein
VTLWFVWVTSVSAPAAAVMSRTEEEIATSFEKFKAACAEKGYLQPKPGPGEDDTVTGVSDDGTLM